MRTDPVSVEAVVINGAPALDPITVIFRDESAGRGGVIVECYGKAWSAFWGGMGDKTVKGFVASCGPDYVAGKLWRDGEKRTKAAEAYLLRIASAVCASCATALQESAQ